MALPFPFDASKAITAIGALGTAAFGLVDATKSFTGLNHVGFDKITGTIESLTPPPDASNGLSQEQILKTLESNWVNGTDLGNQKTIAKSLIKMNMTATNAREVAVVTGLNADELENVAAKIVSNTALTGNEPNVLTRFDFALTALLDEAYQCADLMYRNRARLWAMGISIILGVFAAFTLSSRAADAGLGWDLLTGFIVGLLATPLAPIAKDLSSALVAAIGAVQSTKKKS